MRDVDYISAVLDELKPHLAGIERQFNEENDRFKALLAADRSTIAHVLKFHLIVEVYLNRFLEARFPSLNWDNADLRFAQKLALITSDRMDRAQFVAPGIRELNKIRNRFGHQFDAVLDLSHQTEMLKCLSVARSGVRYTDPIIVLQDFATVACTFLVVREEIDELFKRAFERARKR